LLSFTVRPPSRSMKSKRQTLYRGSIRCRRAEYLLGTPDEVTYTAT
jgi:hypothetical protein